jgi:hypothetical protein
MNLGSNLLMHLVSVEKCSKIDYATSHWVIRSLSALADKDDLALG